MITQTTRGGFGHRLQDLLEIKQRWHYFWKTPRKTKKIYTNFCLFCVLGCVERHPLSMCVQLYSRASDLIIAHHLFPYFLWVQCNGFAEAVHTHTGQCKRTGGCYNELVVALFSTGGGVKGKENLYLLTLWFIYILAFILFVMIPGAQTTGNIAV